MCCRPALLLNVCHFLSLRPMSLTGPFSDPTLPSTSSMDAALATLANIGRNPSTARSDDSASNSVQQGASTRHVDTTDNDSGFLKDAAWLDVGGSMQPPTPALAFGGTLNRHLEQPMYPVGGVTDRPFHAVDRNRYSVAWKGRGLIIFLCRGLTSRSRPCCDTKLCSTHYTRETV